MLQCAINDSPSELSSLLNAMQMSADFDNLYWTGQGGPGINGNEGVLHITQRSRSRASPSDGPTLGPITPASNTPLLHPYTPTSPCNGICTAIEPPQTNHIYITTPSIVENSLNSIQVITAQQTRPKRRVQPSYNSAYSWWGEERCRSHYSNMQDKQLEQQHLPVQWPQLVSSRQTKNKMGSNSIASP